MSRPIASDLADVTDGIRIFNDGLKNGDPEDRERLSALLAYFRAWYYSPQLDAVGPSKFIGYRGMDMPTYLGAQDLDGRVTEPILTKWFELMQPGTPEYHHIAARVDGLLRSYGKVPNRTARYCAPRGWRLAEQGAGGARGPEANAGGREPSDDGSLSSIGEVFWKAFLTLYPDDQEGLARRILAHRGRA